ncbi:MAG TPA: DUF6596 domain-containing protein, partial [Propionibacteriaceae bacterium]|nr:DUF6596 domain-containing protein [Propionibacteriaceae bacterium]
AEVPFAVPPADERPARLSSVLSVLYLIFTEGSTATSGEQWIRPDLAFEAIRLTRVLAQLMPREPEVQGLLALLELTAARFPARVGADGTPVLLENQDRRHWDRSAIARGRAALAQAGRSGRGLGPFGLQAAIAECHAVAPSVTETNWSRIVVLYDALSRIPPSPVVELNRAVAVSMADGPDAALPLVDDLLARGSLTGSHLLPAVRGELLNRLGRTEEARAEFGRAIELCRNEAERAVLRSKIARADRGGWPATRASGSAAPRPGPAR